VGDELKEVAGPRLNRPGESECWELVQRIASGRHLLKAPQLREILLYITRRNLEENAAAISEQEIGCKALGRRPDFNPNEDNIVRVQVRHLRHRLGEYFASEGAGEPLLITIPKGGYVPRFEWRSDGITAQAPAVTSLPGNDGAVGWRPLRTAWWAFGLMAAALIALLAVTTALWWRRQPAPPPRATSADLIWPRIFAAGQKTDVILSDSCLAALQDILDTDIPLADYLSGAYPGKLIQSVTDRQLRSALQLLMARQYTSLGDAALASKLIELSRRYEAQVNIRYSRFLSVRDFKTGNFVLVGSHRSIPWVQLFEPQLNFSLERDPAAHTYVFRNRAPLRGEPTKYWSSGGSDCDTYADIALMPNLGGTGYVLMLAGIDMAGTEAAGELVTSPEFSKLLRQYLGPQGGLAPPYIELLMQAKAVAGTTQSPKIVAHRLLPGRSISPTSASGGTSQ